MSGVDFASFHTTYPCWLLFEYACGIVVAIVVYVCVGQRFQNRGEVLLGVFVLMLSNINIVWQKIA